MRVLAISGSLRRESWNTKLLRAAAEVLPPGAELVIWDGLKSIPPFDEDDERFPGPEVKALRAAVAEADAVLISTPEYNHSLPGQLKNALDWLSRPFATTVMRGKPTAVIGTSTSLFGAVWAQAEARKVLGAMGAPVLDRELPVSTAHERFDAEGRLVDEDVRSELTSILRELAGVASATAAAA